jgi:phosphatidate cytidylyltransferase
MLKLRIATAAVLAVVVLGVLFGLPPLAGVALFALAMGAGAWEWAAFAGWSDRPRRLGYLLVTAALGALAWRVTDGREAWEALMTAAALWWCVAFAWLAWRPLAVGPVRAALAGLVALLPAWIGFARLLLIEEPHRGVVYVFYLLLIIWAADIGAYFAGRAFGRVKLAPQVSPSKTWEGLLGGLAGGLVLALAGAAVLHLPLLAAAALGLGVVIASVIGDLTESMFKRHAGLKDSSQLLPGHGGILDRIDSLISGVPFFVLGLGWLGVIR